MVNKFIRDSIAPCALPKYDFRRMEEIRGEVYLLIPRGFNSESYQTIPFGAGEMVCLGVMQKAFVDGLALSQEELVNLLKSTSMSGLIREAPGFLNETLEHLIRNRIVHLDPEATQKSYKIRKGPAFDKTLLCEKNPEGDKAD